MKRTCERCKAYTFRIGYRDIWGHHCSLRYPISTNGNPVGECPKPLTWTEYGAAMARDTIKKAEQAGKE